MTVINGEFIISRKSDVIFKDGNLVHGVFTSELYGTTDGGGRLEDILKTRHIPLGDGCDYKLDGKEHVVLEKIYEVGGSGILHIGKVDFYN